MSLSILQAVDTLGAGDLFHGAFTLALSRRSEAGGNITGNTVLSRDLGAKLQLLKGGFSVARGNASHAGIFDELKLAAAPLGLLLIPVSAKRFDEFETAIAMMTSKLPSW